MAENISALRTCGIYEAVLCRALIAEYGHSLSSHYVLELSRLIRSELNVGGPTIRDRTRAGSDDPGPGSGSVFQAAASMLELGICWTTEERAMLRAEQLPSLTVWRLEVDALDVLFYDAKTKTFVCVDTPGIPTPTRKAIYRRSRIEAVSHRGQSEGKPGGWLAKVLIIWDEHGERHQQAVSDPQPRLFETRDEADILAFQLARTWIDENG